MQSKYFFILFLTMFFISCQNKKQETKPPEQVSKKERSETEMKITSSEFKDGELMPGKFTCDGENISPQLSWTGFPTGVKSFAIICNDPDAPSGDWVHWVIYNISPGVNELKEKYPKDNSSENGTKQGITDFKKTGYDGPCPPGGTHRYYFKLYALDNLIDKDDLTKSKLLKAMEGHIIASAELIGKYKRQ